MPIGRLYIKTAIKEDGCRNGSCSFDDSKSGNQGA